MRRWIEKTKIWSNLQIFLIYATTPFLSMRILLSFTILLLLFGCSSENKNNSKNINEIKNQIVRIKTYEKYDSMFDIDFKNFTYPWTEEIKGKEKTYTLKNGKFSEEEGRTLNLEVVSYDDSDSQALITIRVQDGNATYHILYIYDLNNGVLKLIQSFDFDADNIFNSASNAHSELIIEVYTIVGGDGQCCPSIIERRHYKQEDGKFNLVETQKIPNNYVERLTRSRK